MGFFQFIYLIFWGVLCGYFSVQLLYYAFATVIIFIELKRVPKSLSIGLAYAPTLHFSGYLAAMCAGFYLTTEVLDFDHFQRHPMFIIFCVVGIVFSILPAATRLTAWHQSIRELF